MLLAAFCAPPLSLYAVARTRLGPTWAFALAYLLMVQSPNLRGVGSPLAGMWTHGVGAALLLALIPLASRPRLSAAETPLLAALLAVIGLTHFFALLAAIAVVGVTSVGLLRGDPEMRDELGRRSIAAGVAAIASAAYWLPFLQTATPEQAPLDQLSPKALLIKLFLPSNTLYLLDARYSEAIQWQLHLTDAIPLAGLIVLGVAASFLRDHGPSSGVARTGRLLALLFVIALLVHAAHPVRMLGPVPWRHLDWVRIGMALSAIPLLERLPAPSRLLRRLSEVLALGLAFWWARPLAADHPAATASEWAALSRTWQWIRRHAEPDWGRLYLLDTFGGDWSAGGLNHSHVLALTHRETGVPVLGAYYGVVPYRTRWTLSEFNRLFNLRALPREGLAVMMDKTNAQAVLTTNVHARRWFADTGDFDELFAHDRYAVFRRKGARSEWIAPLTPTNHVSDVAVDNASVRFTLRSEHPRSSVVAKFSWHPWWRLSGAGGAQLVESPDGFLGIKGVAAGRHDIALRYAESPWGGRISALGWTMLAGWGIAVAARRRRKRPAPTTP
jgi:hypothetical protein